MRQADTQRDFIIPAASAPAAEVAERDAAATPAPLTRTAFRGRSRRAFVLPLWFGVGATGLVAAAVALALYLRF